MLSALTARTKDTGPLPQGHMLEFAAAAATGRSSATIDIEALSEIAGLASAADKVTQRRAPLGDGCGKYILGSRGEPVIALAADAPGCSPRVDSRQKQRFAGIDIAHANDHSIVHQKRLHRGLPPRERA